MKNSLLVLQIHECVKSHTKIWIVWMIQYSMTFKFWSYESPYNEMTKIWRNIDCAMIHNSTEKFIIWILLLDFGQKLTFIIYYVVYYIIIKNPTKWILFLLIFHESFNLFFDLIFISVAWINYFYPTFEKIWLK